PPRMTTAAPTAGSAASRALARTGHDVRSPRRSLRWRSNHHTVRHSATTSRAAGTMPTTNSAPTERPAVTAYMIAGMDGGIIGAMREEAPVTPSAKGVGYPRLIICGTCTRPIAAASAIAAPDIQEKPKLVATLT